MYGQKTEQTKVVLDGAEQLHIFDEAEADIVPAEVKITEVKSHKRKTKRTHDEIMAEVSVKEVLHEMEDTSCEKCGSKMEVIGRAKLYEELIYEPAKLYRVIHSAVTCKCTECGMHPEVDDKLRISSLAISSRRLHRSP